MLQYFHFLCRAPVSHQQFRVFFVFLGAALSFIVNITFFRMKEKLEKVNSSEDMMYPHL